MYIVRSRLDPVPLPNWSRLDPLGVPVVQSVPRLIKTGCLRNPDTFIKFSDRKGLVLVFIRFGDRKGLVFSFETKSLASPKFALLSVTLHVC